MEPLRPVSAIRIDGAREAKTHHHPSMATARTTEQVSTWPYSRTDCAIMPWTRGGMRETSAPQSGSISDSRDLLEALINQSSGSSKRSQNRTNTRPSMAI